MNYESSGAGITDGGELPDMGEGNQIQVVWKMIKHSQLLGRLSNPNRKLLDARKARD